jgi:hypothetical protein
MAVGRVGTNQFSVSNFIVDGGGLQLGATHTTIAAAFSDASSGDTVYIRPGTYTEDPTVPVGINVAALPGTAAPGAGNVTIVGKLTQTATGTSTFSNIIFATNSDVMLDFGGSGLIQTSFQNCSFFLLDADGLTINNASGNPNFRNCTFHQTGDTFDYFNITLCGTVTYTDCRFFVSGAIGTSDIDAGVVAFTNCNLHQLFTCSGSSFYRIKRCSWGPGQNVTFLTTAGTGTTNIKGLILDSGTAVAISIGSGTTVNAQQLSIKSTNENPIDGAGTINYSTIDFLESGHSISTATENPGSFRAATIDLTHTATESDDHSLEIDCDAAGFGDVKALDIDYITGAMTAVQDEECILVNIDETASLGGIINGYEVLTTAEGSAVVNGYTTGINVNPIVHESGTFGDADDILNIAVDVTTELAGGGSGAISIFVADDDTFTIGDAATWDEFEIILATGASGSGVAPVFEYSTGGSNYTAFSPADGTNGFRNSGAILWDSSTLAGWATATSGRFEIRITRTRNSLSTTPIIDELQISATTEFSWDKDGNLDVNDIIVANGISFDAGGNSLDEYEEGTFIPVLTGSTNPPDTITYTAQSGKYTRVGNKVTVKISISINAFTLGSGSGSARITGLPFTSSNDTPLTNVGSVFFHQVGYAANASLATVVDENVAYVRFAESISSTGQGTVDLSDFAAGDLLRAEITYWI